MRYSISVLSYYYHEYSPQSLFIQSLPLAYICECDNFVCIPDTFFFRILLVL